MATKPVLADVAYWNYKINPAETIIDTAGTTAYVDTTLHEIRLQQIAPKTVSMWGDEYLDYIVLSPNGFKHFAFDDATGTMKEVALLGKNTMTNPLTLFISNPYPDAVIFNNQNSKITHYSFTGLDMQENPAMAVSGITNVVTVIDLFCGAGGSSSGASAAGAWVKYAVNHWAVAIKTHKANHSKTHHIQNRLELVDPRQFHGVDMIIASPECTNHSRAKGAKPRDEQSRATAFEVIRFADLIRPRWIVVENVPDFQSWALYPVWLQALNKLGYGTREQILNSADFGIPQTRQRYFMTAELGKVPQRLNPQ
ncbi:DNA cytosine methyltransferase [Bacteroides sp.]|uniref:DNA cytosine methyltransferase n=1 Tax=Bacteroides sp. TaxID=29523 RepID=UPI00260E3F8E|nr:DNA cytosine methyltransferase [Bacteroides sp.]MDD3040813.1 DNA cytosine methyltransferase [Bacteroides sp.]